MYDFYLGVDLGQANDYTAIALAEEAVWVSPEAAPRLNLAAHGWHSPADLTPWQVEEARRWAGRYGRPDDPPLAVRHLERLPLGTSYVAVTDHVLRLYETPPLGGGRCALLVDATGVGRAVTDTMVAAGLPVVAITITGGGGVTGGIAQGLHVAKRELIGATQVALQARRLRVAAALPEAATLARELAAMKVRVTAAANETFDVWRSGVHDDLALAVAMIAWFRGWYCEHLDWQTRAAQRRTADDEPDPIPRDAAAMHRSALIHAAQHRTQGV